MHETIVVAAAVAQRPGRAGHAWAILNWMAGFRQRGHDVVFVDHIDPNLGDVARGVDWVADVMRGFDWIVLTPDGANAGLSRRALVERASGALLLNVNGYLEEPDLVDRVERRVLLDIDPGFGQAWQHAGLARPFQGHDAYVTVGLNVGRSDCGVPDLGLPWITTVPPVDLARWADSAPPLDGAFTTVASWRGPFAPVEVGGAIHGLRAHQARAYADLPRRAGALMEMALDIDDSDEADRRQLIAGGWLVRSPDEVGGDLDAYRRYLAGSLAEFAVAKHAYVSLRTGWFSDRSACYLASGRPVVVSDTGLAGHLPVGEGLLTYSTVDQAVAAVAEVRRDPARHAKAARQLAEDVFDAGAVVDALVRKIAA